MSQIAPLVEGLGTPTPKDMATIRKLELAVVEHSLKSLMTFPCIQTLVERGKLTLHGAYFGVATGVLLVRDPETGEFKPCVQPDSLS